MTILYEERAWHPPTQNHHQQRDFFDKALKKDVSFRSVSAVGSPKIEVDKPMTRGVILRHVYGSERNSAFWGVTVVSYEMSVHK